MKIKQNRIYGVLFLLCSFLLSCSNNVVFQEAKELPASGWNKDSIIIFNFLATDTSGIYDIIADVRNDGDYRYQNFWLFINSVSPDTVVYKDTLECVLADDYGKWIGKGSGSLHHLPVSYLENIKFPVPGNYRFEVIQGMREDTLLGIHDIGIRIIKK